MTEKEESYCRLCAEPTPKTQLITSDEDVAKSSKISTKMLWINVDMSSTNPLPTTICFSCFDLLERTWQFLHNVRAAQQKLFSIFQPTESHVEIDASVGKPVNENWDKFTDTKKEIKDEEIEAEFFTDVNPESLLLEIKREKYSDGGDTHDGFNSTDSDLPLVMTVKKKKKMKKKCKDKSKTSRNVQIPLPVHASWEEHSCQCAHCDAQCKNISSLRVHALEIHNSCCIFKCSYCDKVLANYKYFINHSRIHNNLLRYCCEICDQQFSLPSDVKHHRQWEHQPSILCSNCGVTFETNEQLQDHIVSYSKGLIKRRKKDIFTEKEGDLKCERCNKEFKSRSNLIQHKLVHTERSRDFSCHVCGKMFYTKGALSTHMMTHEEVKPFKCEFCPMTFRARGNLHSHSSLHSGAKPFVCEQCGKSFRVKRHLKSHSIVHTDLMPYVCQYCNKTFRFKTRLNLHLRQHTGAKPYHCVYCERDFTNGSNFKKHMKRRHNIDTSKKKYNNIVDTDAMSMNIVEVN